MSFDFDSLYSAYSTLSKAERMAKGVSRGAKYAKSAYNKAPRRRSLRGIAGSRGRSSSKASDLKKLKRTVKELKKDFACSRSKHLHVYNASGTVTAVDNSQRWASISGGTLTGLHNATDEIRFFDPSNPATLITADASIASYAQEIEFMNINSRLEFRNNYMTDCHISVYKCTPKYATNDNPHVTITDALADQQISGTNPIESNLGFYPTDYELFRDRWTIKETKTTLLRAGQSLNCSYNTGKFCFKPNEADHDGDSFRKNSSFAYLVHIHGAPAHENSATQGRATCGVDWVHTMRFKIEYDSGGASLEDLSTFAGLNTMSPARQGVTQIPDNITYSTV